MILGRTRAERWVLYNIHNRKFDGEIILVYGNQDGTLSFHEQTVSQPADSALLGELETRIEGESVIHEVIPFRRRSEQEQQQLLEQIEQHKNRRARAHANYPLDQRLKDLSRSRAL